MDDNVRPKANGYAVSNSTTRRSAIMLDLENLVDRIDAEFSTVEAKYQKAIVENLQTYKDRQKRLETLAKVFDELREVWRPRLDVLTNKFGDRVQVTPRLIPSTREATFEFQSRLARI